MEHEHDEWELPRANTPPLPDDRIEWMTGEETPEEREVQIRTLIDRMIDLLSPGGMVKAHETYGIVLCWVPINRTQPALMMGAGDIITAMNEGGKELMALAARRQMGA